MARTNVYRYAESELPVVEGWFNPDKAVETIYERTEWDGENEVSVHASRYGHHLLYRTAGGRWVLHTWSQWQGTMPTFQFVDDAAAKAWLVHNESDDVIAKYFGELEEERGPGRPGIGDPINIRLPSALLARVDAAATAAGVSRAEMIRRSIVIPTTGGCIECGKPGPSDNFCDECSATVQLLPPDDNEE